MKFEKQFIAIALALQSLTFIQLPHSQAGLIIGAIAGNPGGGALIGSAIGAAGAGAFGLALGLSDTPKGHRISPTGVLIVTGFGVALGAAGGALLSIDQKSFANEVSDGFKNRYPFLNSPESRTALVALIYEKINQQIKTSPENTSHFIEVNSAECSEVLSGAALSEPELLLICDDLK